MITFLHDLRENDVIHHKLIYSFESTVYFNYHFNQQYTMQSADNIQHYYNMFRPNFIAKFDKQMFIREMNNTELCIYLKRVNFLQ